MMICCERSDALTRRATSLARVVLGTSGLRRAQAVRGTSFHFQVA